MDEPKKNENFTEKSEATENYEFVTETIKKRPVNVKKIIKKVLFTLLLAVIFGVAASVTFVFLYPKLNARFNPDDGTVAVSLPQPETQAEVEAIQEKSKDEETLEGDKGSDNVPEDEPDELNDNQNDAENESGQVSANQDDAADMPDLEADNQSEKSESTVVNNIVQTIEKDLEIDDYKSLLGKISDVANAAKKSLVTVSSISSDTDWFNNSFESNKSTIGLIFADNGKELLILSSTSIFRKALNVKVTFDDGCVCPAKIKTSDNNTGLCVVGVELDKIPEETVEGISKAEFGGLATSAVGVPIIAVGAPYGISGSYGMGQITSNSTVIDKTDTSVGIISTNIYGSTASSGVLINYSGRIVGIICHEDVSDDMPNMIMAYSVTDIMDTIEKLSNGQILAKLGIMGTYVTEDANERLGVPFGTYVKEVVADSPAMNVGIRNGDVIVKMGTTDISSFVDFKAAMLKCNPGDIVVITLMRPGREGYTEVSYEVTLEAL